jgi:hypothetical protein
VLGICTRYCYHEASQVALRIANWEKARGGEVTMFTATCCAPPVDAFWDRHIACASLVKFSRWVEKCSTVLWTHVPHREQVEWCNKRKIHTVIHPLWQELTENNKAPLRAANRVLATSQGFARMLQTRLAIKNVSVAPFDPGLPFTCKDKHLTTAGPWVLLPLYDREPQKMEGTAIEIAGRLLEARADVRLSVIYNSSTLSSRAKRRLQDFQHYFGQRVQCHRSVPFARRPMLFGHHDVTMWPAHFDSVGLTPLTSLSMGTPVVAFNSPPLQEFLTKHNSIPVPCDARYNRVGVPQIEPDYRLYERCLQNAVINRNYLAELQQTVLHGLEHRRKSFGEMLSQVIC